jgi:hypothetical protein
VLLKKQTNKKTPKNQLTNETEIEIADGFIN